MSLKYLSPLTLLALAAPAIAATPATHYWTFDNTTNDAAGGMNGTLQGGATYGAAVPGLSHSTASLNLTNGDDWFDAASVGTVSGSYTVSAWVNASTLAGNHNFFDTRRPTDNGFDAKLQNGNNIHGDIGNGAGAWLTTGADGGFNYTTDQWNNITYVVEPDHWSIYANGLQISQGTYGANNPVLFDANHNLNIGRHSGGSEYFDGLIDDVAVWNSALSPQQIYAISQGTQPSALGDTVVDPHRHGALSFHAITGDADSGIDPSKNYTHLLDFGGGPLATVNGVAFSQGQPSETSGGTWASTIPNNHNGNGATNVPNTDGVHQLLDDFNFNDANGIISVGGLTPGQSYETTLYIRNWGGDRDQVIEFDVNMDGIPERATRIDPDNATQTPPDLDVANRAFAMKYTFVAESDVLRINTNQVAAGTFHLYGLSNENITDGVNTRLPIDSLFSTGLDANGQPLAPGSADPHWTLQPGAAQGTEIIVMTPNTAWSPNDPGSQFVGVVDNGATGVAIGDYRYVTEFDLTDRNPDTAEVIMSIFADNTVTDVLLNGVSTGIFHEGFGQTTGGMFTLDSGFVYGINTLEFILNNADGGNGPNPGGLRIDLSGTAAIPEPARALLLAFGALGLALRRRR